MRLWFSTVSATGIALIPVLMALDFGYSSVGAWATILIFGVLLIKATVTESVDFLYISVLCFFYIFMILAPLLQIEAGIFPWVDAYTTEDVETSWLITAVALVFFELGYLGLGTWYRGPNTVKILPTRLISPVGAFNLFMIALFFTILGIAFTGFDVLFLPRNKATTLLGEKMGGSTHITTMINALMRVPPTVIMLLFMYDFYNRLVSASRKPWLNINTVFMFLTVVLVAVVNNPISTARFWVGAIILTVVLLALYARRKNTAFFWFTLNLTLMVVVFPIADLYRNTLDFNILEDTVELSPAKELTYNADFDAFQQLVNAKVVVDHNGVQYGRQFASSILFFVPRFVWPNKAEPTGMYVANDRNYSFGNLSSPLMAEFYVDGGLIGTILGMLLLGLLYRYLFELSKRRTILIGCFYCFFATYQFYFLRGSLMTVSNYMLVALAFLGGIYLFRNLIFMKDISDGADGVFTHGHQV